MEDTRSAAPWPVGISYEGDYHVAQEYLPTVKKLLSDLQNRLAIGGIDSGRAHLRLSDTDYCYAISAGGIQRCHIVASTKQEPQPKFIRVSMFLSGVVIDGLLTEETEEDSVTATYLDSFIATKACAALFAKELPKLNYGGKVSGANKNKKLAIDLPDDFNGYPVPGDHRKAFPFRWEEDKFGYYHWGFYYGLGGNPYYGKHLSQYFHLKPTCYSGSMPKLIQALMGFGFDIGKAYWLSDSTGQFTAAPIKSSYEEKIVQNGLQIVYDYRFYRTHGLYLAIDNKRWIVEIGMTRGIVIMPLPLNPLTETKRFRTLVSKNKDTASLTVLDEFGGYPTGECFDSNPDGYAAWKRAGCYIELLSAEVMASKFYNDWSPYSSALGWAFSRSGHEACNTAWRCDDTTGKCPVGGAFYILLNIGESKKKNTNRKLIGKLRAGFVQSAQGQPGGDAALWKLDYLTDEQLSSITDFTSLDQLEVPPIAEATASISNPNQGIIFIIPTG